MAHTYTLVSPTQNISARYYKSVRSLKSWAKHYMETCAVPEDLVLVKRHDGSYGFMRFNSPVFSASLTSKIVDFWFPKDLKYEQ